jgi:hypothetical protein
MRDLREALGRVALFAQRTLAPEKYSLKVATDLKGELWNYQPALLAAPRG